MHTIRAAAAAGLIALALAGCAQLMTAYNVASGVAITQNDLNGLVSAYDTTVLRPFNLYRYTNYSDTLPAAQLAPRRYCTKAAPFSVSAPCADYAVLAKMQPVLAAVDSAEKTLQADVTACTQNNDQSACTGIAAAKAAFQSAVSVAQATATSLGVI